MPDQEMQHSLTGWLQALGSTALAPVTYAIPRARRPPLPGGVFVFSSDAAKSGTATPAIAGFMHGFYWPLFYPDVWAWMPIAVLELLALAVSVIIFTGGPPPGSPPQLSGSRAPLSCTQVAALLIFPGPWPCLARPVAPLPG